jgi:hypothetical protein
MPYATRIVEPTHFDQTASNKSTRRTRIVEPTPTPAFNYGTRRMHDKRGNSMPDWFQTRSAHGYGV